MTSATIASSNPPPPVIMTVVREARAARIAGVGEELASIGRVVAPAGSRRRSGRGSRAGPWSWRPGRSRRSPPARPSAASRPPRRTPCGPGRRRTAAARVEAVVLGRQRADLAELRPERLVVGDPRGVDAAHAGVVEVARSRRPRPGCPAEVTDQLDLRDRRRPGPVVAVGGQAQTRRGGAGQDVSAAGHEPRAGQERGLIGADARRHDREARAGHDVDEVRGRPDEVDDQVAGRIVGSQRDRGGIGRAPAKVVLGALDVERERRQRRRMRRIDQPEPAPATSDGRIGDPSEKVRPERRWNVTCRPPSSNRHDSARAGRTCRSGRRSSATRTAGR